MCTRLPFFSLHFSSSQRPKLFYHLFLLLVLILSVATPLAAQEAGLDALDRVNALHATAPTLEDLLKQDDGRWSLKRGINNTVFFAANGLHVRSQTTDKDKPNLAMSQSSLAAEAMLVEVEARHIKGSLFNGFGFYLMQAPGDYIFFYISNNGYAAIQHAALNTQEMLVDWHKSSAIQAQNQATNQIGLLVEEGQATLFANDTEVATISGLAVEGATLGLVATSYKEGITEVAFRDLRYWDLNDQTDTRTTAQEKSSVDIAAQLQAAEFTLDDLPNGFERLSRSEVQTLLDNSLLDDLEEDGSVKIMNRFGFLHFADDIFVVGASGSIVDSIDGMIPYMNTILKRDSSVELLELGQIGDESVAFGITTVDGGESQSFEFLLFRRDQLLAQLLVGYAEDTEPLITLKDLAQLWDDRLVDLSRGLPVEIVEIDYLKDGIALLEQGNWQQAVESLTQAIELDPTDTEAYYYRGLAYYQLGVEDADYYVMAIEDLTQAMASEEFFVEAGTARNRINQVADAELLLATYTEQIEKNENLAAAFAGRGIVYRDQVGDYQMAIADLSQAIELASEYQRGDYYVERAFAYMEGGNSEATIEDATQAIEHEYPTDICSAYAYRGSEYARLGKYADAEADLERARTNCGDDSATLAFVSHQLGIVRYYQGKTEDAFSLFIDAINSRVEAAREAARVSWEDSFGSESEEEFEALITYFEAIIDDYQLQAWRERKLDSGYAKYTSVFEAYEDMYAGAARTYGWLGGIYEDQAEYDEAIDSYTMAIQMDPADTGLTDWYVSRGWIFYNQDDFGAARDDLTMVVTLGRSDASEVATAYNLLGNIASDEGSHQEALAHYNMAISIRPDRAVIYYNRALTFYDLDDYPSAIADLEMVLEMSDDAELREDAEEWLSALE